MAKITLACGRQAVVDDADLSLVAGYSWCSVPRQSSYGGRYARTTCDGKNLYMHRLLLPDSEMVDHVDGDGLNNRRDNIRPCTAAQNSMNRRPWAASGNKGVYQNGFYIDGTPRWKVQVQAEGRRVNGGSYRRLRDASDAADRLAVDLHGEFACLNLAEAA